jgi:RNA polymerase sigma-70 factor (ECF subfamily)
MTTRAGIDRLRSAQAKREVYVGPWLPEPIPTPDDPANPAAVAVLDESLTIGYLHLMEQLTPLERAAYLLHDVFDFSYREIAPMVDREEANCRQLASRARAKLKATRPDELATPARAVETDVCNQLLGAVMGGDIDQVMALMTEDIVHISDGGEHHRAARQPVIGRDRVARLLVNLAARIPDPEQARVEFKLLRVNLQPAVLLVYDGQPASLVVIELAGELVRRLYAVVNPDKLRSVMEGS